MKNFVKTVLSTTAASIAGTIIGMAFMAAFVNRSFGRVPNDWKRILLDMPLGEKQESEEFEERYPDNNWLQQGN